MLTLLPSGSNRWKKVRRKKGAIYNIGTNLAVSDVDAARAWIKKQLPSVARDGAVQNRVLQGRFDEPEETLPLIQSISNKRIRIWLMQHTLETLARRDADLAAEHVESLELTDQWMELIEQHRAVQDRFQESSPPPLESMIEAGKSPN